MVIKPPSHFRHLGRKIGTAKPTRYGLHTASSSPDPPFLPTNMWQSATFRGDQSVGRRASSDRSSAGPNRSCKRDRRRSRPPLSNPKHRRGRGGDFKRGGIGRQLATVHPSCSRTRDRIWSALSFGQTST